MKRIITTVLAVIMLFSLSLSFTSCQQLLERVFNFQIMNQSPYHTIYQDLDINKYVQKTVDYDQITVSNLTITEFVNADLEKLRSKNKTFCAHDEDHAAEIGDTVMINYLGRPVNQQLHLPEATLNGLQNMNNDPYALELGSGAFIGAYESTERPDKNNPGFEEQLVGARAGDTVTVTVTFPDDYNTKELCGAVVEFTVQVSSVGYMDESVLDDEFIRKNTDYETLDEYTAAVREYYKNELTYSACVNTLTVTPHENMMYSEYGMTIEFLFRDLHLELTQEEYDTRVGKLNNGYKPSFSLQDFIIDTDDQNGSQEGEQEGDSQTIIFHGYFGVVSYEDKILEIQKAMVTEKLCELVQFTD